MKRAFFVLVFAAIFAGGVFAQDAFNTNLSFRTANANFNTGFRFNLMSEQETSDSGIAITDDPVMAGFANIPFGMWSWMNEDWLGGGVTAGFMGAGIALLVINMINNMDREKDEEPDKRKISPLTLAGLGAIAGGAVFGYVRGFMMAKEMRSASVAENSSNPLDHISLVVLPAFDNRKVIGSLTYSVSF